MDLSNVWEWCTWGFSIGLALGFFAYFLGLWSGIGFRWFSDHVKG